MIRRSLLVSLWMLLPACRPMASRSEPRPDPRLAHAREAADWKRYDANLELLHHARREMRRNFLLPAKPPLDGPLEQLAWTVAAASERNVLASMTAQEALSDRTHSQQALALAEQQVEWAAAQSDAARDELAARVRELRQALLVGDVADNLRRVERLSGTRSGSHMQLLRALVAEIRDEQRR